MPMLKYRRPAADYGPANTKPLAEHAAKFFMGSIKIMMLMGVLYVMPKLISHSFNSGFSSQHSHHSHDSAHRLY